MGENRNMCRVWWGDVKENSQFEDPGIDGSVLLSGF
jgi:hypothetical protein